MRESYSVFMKWLTVFTLVLYPIAFFFIKNNTTLDLLSSSTLVIFCSAFLLLSKIYAHSLTKDLKFMLSFLASGIFIMIIAHSSFLVLFSINYSTATVVANYIINISFLPTLALVFYRLFKDSSNLNRRILLFVFFFIILIFSGFFILLLGILHYRFVYVSNVSLLYAVEIRFILDLILLTFSIILFAFYFHMDFGDYWLVAVVASLFSINSDILYLLYLMGSSKSYHVSKVFHIYIFSVLIIGLILLGKYPKKAISIHEIHKERNLYREQYWELDALVKQLVSLNRFFQHDLHNDLAVIQNAIDVYKETKEERFLNMAERRIETVEERLSSLRTPNNIINSLSIKAIPIQILKEVAKIFPDVELVIPNKDITIKGNQLIYYVFYNMIDNSYSHGGENVKVKIIVKEENNDKVKIEVIDNGVGISDEAKNRIEHEIIRPDSKKGIGMILAKKTIEQLGGTFSVSRNKPKGTIFTVILPKFSSLEETNGEEEA